MVALGHQCYLDSYFHEKNFDILYLKKMQSIKSLSLFLTHSLSLSIYIYIHGFFL